MNRSNIFISAYDNTIQVNTADEAEKLAKENPGVLVYSLWIPALKIEAAPNE